MEIKTIDEEMIAKIQAPLPAEAITQHPTKTYLSSIKAIYVLERLNEVFGIGVWSIKTDQIGEVTDKGMVVVKVIFEIPQYGIYYESFGGNDNGGETNKNFDLGDAYKGATTDAITKICSYIGIGMDVFKGKQKGEGAKPSYANNDDLGWITPKDIEAIGKLLETGKDLSMKEVRTKYKISKESAKRLNDLGIK